MPILKKLEETFNRVDALTKVELTPFVTKTKALSEIQQALMSADYNTKLDDCFKEMMDAAASYRNAHNQEEFRLLLQAMGDVKELKTAAAKTIKSVDKKGLKTARETAGRLLKEIEEIDSKIQSMMETRDNLEKERKSSLNSIKILEQDVQRTQKKIDSMQKRVEEAAPVMKEQAMNHRPDFLEGVKAVQTTAEVAELMKTDLKKMSASEKEKICSYIRASARIFKQTLRRKDNTPRKKQIDVKNTIRMAAQTNGEPIKIKYKEPKKSHAKVIIMVDISGSCRAASTLALYFMALMGTVFPGGCRKFVFVNSLVPVDSAFRDTDVDEGIETVLRTVPTRGIYSDYGTVVDQLKKDYGGIIHRDTTVIILGDARNNKNATHEDEVKYIADRCKKLIWLNPDDPQKWDQGDSVIGMYKEAGATVYRVQTVGDLIEFLLSIRV